METHDVLRLSRNFGSFVGPALQIAGIRLRGWRKKRHTAKVLAGLSAEQLRDCGIESPQLNVPTVEVPRGLMQQLMSMR